MGARQLSGLSLPAMPPWPTLRRGLMMALAGTMLILAAYMLWFRDSSFVKVERVDVIGAETAPDVTAALTTEAGKMTTLHVDDDALRATVADDPAVLSLSTDADFPHSLTITVDLRRPAGWLDVDGGTVVAGDGVILASGVDRPEGVPTLDVEPSPSGARVDGPALVTARTLGAAPAALLAEAQSATLDPQHGPVVTLSGGIELRFGDPSRADQKWSAAAAVLANRQFEGASYIDLSVPSRPVSG